MKSPIAYYPGRGSSIHQGLGLDLTEKGYSLIGLDMHQRFLRQPFQNQIKQLWAQVQQRLWSPRGHIIAKSYGAYVLLHALADAEPFPGRILLFSPVLGAAFVRKDGIYRGSIPPRANKLKKMAEQGLFPVPNYLEIHTGALDNGCDPDLAKLLIKSLPNGKIYIKDNCGHSLEPAYELKIALDFLKN